MKKLKKLIPIIAAVLMLGSCGRTAETDAGPAETAGPGVTEEVTTTSAPESSDPESRAETTVTASSGNIGVGDDEWIKDGIRSMFGHKTNAEREYEQYMSTYTTTTTTTTNREEFLKELEQAYTLTVDENYVVHRNKGAYEDGLGWEIYFNGQKVLGRVAEKELTYRWDTIPGEYTYYLTSWVGGQYETVSNTLTFTIDEAPPEPVGIEAEIADLKHTIKVRLKTWNMVWEDGAHITYEYTAAYILDTKDGPAAVMILVGEDGSQMVHYMGYTGEPYAELTNYGTSVRYGCLFDESGDRLCVKDGSRVFDALTGEEIDPEPTLYWPMLEGDVFNDTIWVSRDHDIVEESIY